MDGTLEGAEVAMKCTKIVVMICGVLSACSAIAAESSAVHVGEVRMFTISRSDRDGVARLHREGWVEADGQVLGVAEYGQLYQRIGRRWTGRDVAENRFAVPRLQDSTQPKISSDNPFGVLGPGDVITSGRRPVTTRDSPLSYWIFAGEPAAFDTSRQGQ